MTPPSSLRACLFFVYAWLWQLVLRSSGQETVLGNNTVCTGRGLWALPVEKSRCFCLFSSPQWENNAYHRCPCRVYVYKIDDIGGGTGDRTQGLLLPVKCSSTDSNPQPSTCILVHASLVENNLHVVQFTFLCEIPWTFDKITQKPKTKMHLL